MKKYLGENLIIRCISQVDTSTTNLLLLNTNKNIYTTVHIMMLPNLGNYSNMIIAINFYVKLEDYCRFWFPESVDTSQAPTF